MTEQELNKKLAEWAGFKREYANVYLGAVWKNPDGNWYGDTLPNFAQSLDACFKWLVPKLIATNIVLRLGCSRNKHEIVWWAGLLQLGEGMPYHFKEHYHSGGENLTLALCLAIEKLIDDKEEK